MAEPTLKKTKNPKRVAAGKKAWRKAHRGGGKVKRKRGAVSKGYHRARSALGKTIKAIVILAPATVFAYATYHNGKDAGKGRAVIEAIGAFGECYTGVRVQPTGEIVVNYDRLLIGWGPPLIIGGVQYGLKAIHMQGANPFRVMSTLG